MNLPRLLRVGVGMNLPLPLRAWAAKRTKVGGRGRLFSITPASFTPASTTPAFPIPSSFQTP